MLKGGIKQTRLHLSLTAILPIEWDHFTDRTYFLYADIIGAVDINVVPIFINFLVTDPAYKSVGPVDFQVTYQKQ
jgi:hypothetical protein